MTLKNIRYFDLIFIFDLSEHLRKENIIDDDDLDTMEYDDIRTYIFRPDLSKNLTGNEIITTIHPGKSVKITDERFFSHIYESNKKNNCSLIVGHAIIMMNDSIRCSNKNTNHEVLQINYLLYKCFT